MTSHEFEMYLHALLDFNRKINKETSFIILVGTKEYCEISKLHSFKFDTKNEPCYGSIKIKQLNLESSLTIMTNETHNYLYNEQLVLKNGSHLKSN